MKIGDYELDVSGVYEPREDSFILAEEVKKYSKGRVLDMGTGSGLQAVLASYKAEKVLAVDINEKTLEKAKENAKSNKIKNIEFLKSDLFEKVEGKFDLIIFNPPYLPEKRGLYEDSEQWAGGENGRELIEKFAKELGKHLKENGISLTVISSLTGPKEVKNIFNELNFRVELLNKKKIPWEKLYVLKISN